MMIPKEKRIRLKGKALKVLNRLIHARDDYTCIIKGCGRYVQEEEKFHHYPFGCNKSDEENKGVTLCYEHHQLAHGAGRIYINQECAKYLDSVYERH